MTSNVGGLVGNPRQGSKTLAATTSLVDKLVAAIAGAERGPIIDLATFGGRTLDYDDTEVADTRTLVTGLRLLVVATPVYKGSYTGLLKAFLDGYGPGGLSDTYTIPLTIAASPQHSLAGSAHLQPLLDELGGISPGGGLFIPDATAGDPEARDVTIDAWIAAQLPLLTAAVTA